MKSMELLILFARLVIACVSFSDESPINIASCKPQMQDGYVTPYREFLLDQRAAKTEDGWMRILEVDIYLESTEHFLYALHDMNGDDIPELHVRDYNCYSVFAWYNCELSLWYYASGHSWPTNDGAILYTREGAAPPHETYQYFLLDFWGNEILRIVFEKGDINYDGIYDEQDDYFYENVSLSKEDWDRLTKPFLSAPSDKIEWFLLSEGVSHIQ